MFDTLDYEELMTLLHDAIEMQDINLYNRVQAEINRRVSCYE